MSEELRGRISLDTQQHSDQQSTANASVVEKKLYSHHSKVVDAVTRRAVNDDSELAALHTPLAYTADDRLLKNLTGMTEPRVRCDFQIGDQNNPVTLPPLAVKGAHGYDIYFRFDRLVRAHEVVSMKSRRLTLFKLLAPVVRLECMFHGLKPASEISRSSLQTALEFHFSDCDGKKITDFSFSGIRTGAYELNDLSTTKC